MNFVVPSDFESFDFSFPIGACGNSSGWRRSFDLAKFPEYSARRRTELMEVGRSIYFPMLNGGFDEVDRSAARRFIFRQKVKVGSGGMPALSSGGGSALFRQDGKTFKIKRAGVADLGFPRQKLHSFGITFENGELFERTVKSIPGLTDLGTAMNECLVNEEVRALGFCNAYRPVGVLVVNDLPDNPRPDLKLSAVITEVTSDVRVDELAHMNMSSLLAELYREGRIRLDKEYHTPGMFELDRVPLTAMLARFDHLFARSEALGLASGGLYRRLHDAGFVRGFGSAWFGNEVVDRDGTISIVDFDGGTASYYPEGIRSRCQQIEIVSYLSESYMLLADMRPRVCNAFAAVFIDAFLRGHREAASGSVPAGVVRAIIEDHLAVFPVIQELFDLPDDSNPE